jgi:hypothetical protein
LSCWRLRWAPGSQWLGLSTKSRFCWPAGVRIADHPAGAGRAGRDGIRDWCRRGHGHSDVSHDASVDAERRPSVGPTRQLDQIASMTISNRTSATAALQAYLILIDRAANHQTIQHRQLGEQMHQGAKDSLLAPLGRVMRWCCRKGLPSLTALVLTEGPTHSAQDGPPSERQHVFAFDWHTVSPPTLDELA